MNDTWIATKLCDTNDWCAGITMDNNGIIYFTTNDENIYQVRQDNINTEPQILVNIKGAKLNGIVWNGNNILYICDEQRHRILSYSIDTGNLATLAGKTPRHKDGNTKNSRFKNPSTIAMDRNGDLYITDSHHVRKIHLSLVRRSTITVAGSENFEHKDGDAKQAMFQQPDGIAVGEDGTIYVCDVHSHCIRQIKNGVVSTLAGTPEEKGFGVGPFTDSLFKYPSSLVVDADGNLLVGDELSLKKLDLHQKIVSTLKGLPLPMGITSLAISNKFGLFAGGYDCIMKIENKWKWKRWVWIGHLKENPNDCLLATLPKDIINEITQLM